MHDLLEDMRDRVLRHARGMRMETPVPGLGLGVIRQHEVPATVHCGAGVCLVLQGAKQMIVGERSLFYQAGDCFTSLVELPATRSVLHTDPGEPYVATSFSLDPVAVADLLCELPPERLDESLSTFAVAPASERLLDAWARYLALLDTPDDIPTLAPLRGRELLYRLLQAPHGALLRQIAHSEGRLAQVRRAIDWMQRHLQEPAPTALLAEIASMSVPSFNRHFRTITSMSPLQYQKMLRLQAARRLLAIRADVAGAAYAVGYESASQFSREYSRLFGVSPREDAGVFARLREPPVRLR